MPFIKIERRFDQVNCTSKDHDPPTHEYLEPGQYTWQCPHCGHRQTFTVRGVKM
jgi:Zn finger protein HypA/HybF involved in hydrogenase expression